MTHSDSYGNALTTKTGMAVDFYDIGVRSFLGANYGASDAFQQAIDADPEFALGYAALARSRLMDGDMPAAKQALAAAQSTADRLGDALTDREHAHIAILDLLLGGKPVETRAAVIEHVRTSPRDVLMAQLCTNVFGLIGFSGQVGREADMLAYTEMLRPHYDGDWWMMSMHALSLCETGHSTDSLDLMEQSLEINPRNANGSHFKAHALYEAGQTAPGRAYLQEWMTGYDRRAVLHGHLSWHAALWALQDGDADAMWDAVNTGVAPGATHSLPINVLTDTAAIYHRAALAGLEVAPERWAELSDYAAKYFPKTGQSFADMHAALSHAMAGQGDRLAKIAEATNGFAGDLVQPVARAWKAFARQDWNSALDNLVPVLAQSERIGGSRAQRDLLELTYVDVLMKLGRTDEAKRALALRRPCIAHPAPVASLKEQALLH